MKKEMTKEEKRELKAYYDNLKKYKMRTTGSPQLDQKIWDLYGHWLIEPSKIVNQYQIKVAKIPYFDKRDQKNKIMYRRQILVWTNPVHDSGCYRITYRASVSGFTVTCMVTGKRIDSFPYVGINKFLSHYFDNIPQILMELFL